MAHVPVLHRAVAPPLVVHAAHATPHSVIESSAAQCEPHKWKFASHTMPHAPAPQVARPFVGAGHAWAHVPQFAGSVVTSTHAPLHTVLVAPVHPVAHAKPVPDELHIGAAGVHAVAQFPQWPGIVMSVSHPSSGWPLQSA